MIPARLVSGTMAKGALLVACMALLAACAVAGPLGRLGEQLRNLNGKRDLRFVGLIRERLQNPNGFEVGFGISLDAEVDDIEAGLSLGPFKFQLDDVPTEDEEEPKAAASCNLQCDTLTFQTCCLQADGTCPPTGNACPPGFGAGIPGGVAFG